jgi:hypothetical protein
MRHAASHHVLQQEREMLPDGRTTQTGECGPVTCLQAAVRAWRARRRYRQLRRHRPPADPALRRQWAAERLEESSRQLVADMDSARGDIDALFAELDASLAVSRAALDQLVAPAAQRLAQRLQVRVRGWRKLRATAL